MVSSRFLVESPDYCTGAFIDGGNCIKYSFQGRLRTMRCSGLIHISLKADFLRDNIQSVWQLDLLIALMIMLVSNVVQCGRAIAPLMG